MKILTVIVMPMIAVKLILLPSLISNFLNLTDRAIWFLEDQLKSIRVKIHLTLLRQ